MRQLRSSKLEVVLTISDHHTTFSMVSCQKREHGIGKIINIPLDTVSRALPVETSTCEA